MSEYDSVIANHYKSVAEESGLSSDSTMKDNTVRDLETKAIFEFIEKSLENSNSDVVLADIGCGNGYSLKRLSESFPNLKMIGLEKTNELRSLAEERFTENEKVSIIEGDIRDENFLPKESVDLLICQRVLINLLDREDQKSALKNIARVIKKGGRVIFIECFDESLSNLNLARKEFGLDDVGYALHNLYLEEGFFNIDSFIECNESYKYKSNFVSTHYFISRVLHPYFLSNKEFKRNSEFVKFFSGSLNNSGDYGPLKLARFIKL